MGRGIVCRILVDDIVYLFKLLAREGKEASCSKE